MQIGLDLRFLDNNYYSEYVLDLVIKLITINKENNYIIYLNNPNLEFKKRLNKIKNLKNITINNTQIKNFSIKEQTLFLKILKKDKNNLLIFFNHFKPIFYSGEYFIFIPSLKDVYYGNFNSFFEKYKYMFLLEKGLKKSKKVLCFDYNTKNELIERFDIKEEDIFLNQGFFLEKETNNYEENLKINVNTKYGIKNEYFIYSGGDGIEKNIDKLIWAFTKINKNIDLIFFGEDIAKNINLRNQIIENNLKNRIKFLSPIKEQEKYIIYKKSLGVIFPSLYETFPFHLGEAIHYDIPILASNIQSIKHIFSETINYFSPISKSSILKNINLVLEKNNNKTNYQLIKNNFFPEKAAINLLEIIN